MAALLLSVGALPAQSVSSPAPSMASPAADWTVDELVARLQAQREPTVDFEEKTYSSLLTEPLTVTGVLRFTPPATMEKEILRPHHERYVIEGDRVIVDSARRGINKSIALDDYPGLRSLVEAFRASFTGDAVRLKQAYETTIGGDRRQWTLLLRPRGSSGPALVDYILFTGTEGRIETIAIRAPDGDRSVMTLRRGATR